MCRLIPRKVVSTQDFTLSFDFGAEPEYLETANNDKEEGEANIDKEGGEDNNDEEGGDDNIYEEGERIILTKRRKILLQEMIIVLYWILKQLQQMPEMQPSINMTKVRKLF